MTILQGHGFKLFTGNETKQCEPETNFGPADPNLWYWQPNAYQGDVLFTTGYVDILQAVVDAEAYIVQQRERAVRERKEFLAAHPNYDDEDTQDIVVWPVW